MAAPDDDDSKKGAWPPDVEYAVPTGSPDVYDPNYVPPAADPAHDEGGATEGPPAALYGEPAASVDAAWTESGAVATAAPAAPASASTTGAFGALPSPGASGAIATNAFTDEPLLPPELAADGALQAAVGARVPKRAETQPFRDDDDDDPRAPRRSRRTMVVASVSIVAGLAIAALVFLGHANAQHYAIKCDAARAVATQGRAFPPWGTHALSGAEWAAIALPPNAECQPRETDDQAELAKWYLAILVDRATVTLTAKDLLDRPVIAGATPVNPLDAVAAQLDQALLLARDPERRDERKEITRLQGDVEYWRAATRLRDASTVLLESAKQFEAANQQHPRHATDAAAWSAFLHHLADELRAGPNGLPASAPAVLPSSALPVSSEPVPVGTALPVEPDNDTGSAVVPLAPDAGVPSGGVLL